MTIKALILRANNALFPPLATPENPSLSHAGLALTNAGPAEAVLLRGLSRNSSGWPPKPSTIPFGRVAILLRLDRKTGTRHFVLVYLSS
jgi:hypothetical protein